jgi:hypothetical protein
MPVRHARFHFLINVSLLRIFLKTGLAGFPTKKSGPDPIEHCRTTPITKFQPGRRRESGCCLLLLIKKPADVLLGSFYHGRDLCVDVTIANSFFDIHKKIRDPDSFLQFLKSVAPLSIQMC